MEDKVEYKTHAREGVHTWYPNPHDPTEEKYLRKDVLFELMGKSWYEGNLSVAIEDAKVVVDFILGGQARQDEPSVTVSALRQLIMEGLGADMVATPFRTGYFRALLHLKELAGIELGLEFEKMLREEGVTEFHPEWKKIWEERGPGSPIPPSEQSQLETAGFDPAWKKKWDEANGNKRPAECDPPISE